MTTLAINYIVNPFTGFFKSVVRTFEIAGMVRAAAELRRLGYQKEAERALRQVKLLKKS